MRRDARQSRLIIQGGLLPHLHRARERWRDASLTALLVVQCLTIFGVVPLTASGLALPQPLILLLLLVFTSLAIIMARGRWAVPAGLSTLVVVGISTGLGSQDPGLTGRLVSDVIALFTFLLLSAVVFQAAFGPGRFTAHRIRGVVVLYLNIGLVFALLHRIVAALLPGAYEHLPADQTSAAFRATLDYFSFTTLTSLGYGDIVPVHPLARGLAILEATLGQLYPPTLLARVVSLELTGRER